MAGPLPDDPAGLPHIPVRTHARSWHRYPEPSPGAIAMVVYTSGTTGPPKGVQLSRRAIAADLDALAEAWQWTAEDVLVHGLPLYHVHGLVLGLLGSLRFGNRFVHTGKPTPAGYAQACYEAHGTLFWGADGVVTSGGRPSCRRGAQTGAAAGVRECGTTRAGVRQAGAAHRAPARQAATVLQVADHPIDAG